MKQYRTKIANIEMLAPGKLEITVELLESTQIQFQAGQFMEFILGSVIKPYSIVTVPQNHNDLLAFCIGLIDGGTASGILSQKKIGDEILMRGPFGIFLVKDTSQKTCFIATGVGIAPFVSIIPDLFSRGYAEPSSLIFGVRSEGDLFYHNKFLELSGSCKNFTFIPTLSKPQSNWTGEIGRVTGYIQKHHSEYKDRTFYICGSLEMVKDVRNLLLSLGNEPKKIKFEAFT